jgi:uncharacterized protein YjdB
VTVKVPVTGISLSQTTLTLDIGATSTLIASVAPTNATNKALTWASSDPTVASVANGTVTAVSAGTATITVTTADGGFAATCVVTVKAAGSGGGTPHTGDSFVGIMWTSALFLAGLSLVWQSQNGRILKRKVISNKQ